MSTENQSQPDDDLLEEICQLYDIIFNDLTLIVAIDENFVYEFHQNGREYILRGGTRHSADLVHAELDWILHLHSSGIKVSIPVQSRNKKYLELIKSYEKVLNVVVFEKAPGKKADIQNPKEWNDELWEKMGKAIGKMHAASVKYKPENQKNRRRPYYEDSNAQLDNYLDPIEDAIVFKEFMELKEKLRQLPKEKGSYGLIHYDFHTDNFHVHEGDIFIFDWDDSHYFFFIYDLAASFHETIWDNPVEKRQEFADRFIPRFWKGYSEEFQLDRKWLDLLPYFFKWRDFIIYVCLIRDYTNEKTPEWLKQQLPQLITEFRDRIVKHNQIVSIPRDLTEWFPEK